MRAFFGALSLTAALVGLLAGAAGRLPAAVVLLVLAAVLLTPLLLRGPRRIALGPLLHLFLYVLLILGSLVCLQLIALNRGWQWDLSAGARHSFSPLTVGQLRALPEPVDIIAVASDTRELRPLLDRLSALSPRLRHRILRPVRDHFEINRLREDLHVAAIPDGSVGLINRRTGGAPRRTVIPAIDMSQGRAELVFDEQRWVNAIIQITRAAPPKVLFTVDHGERSLADELITARQIFRDLAFEEEHGSTLDIPSAHESRAVGRVQRRRPSPRRDRRGRPQQRGRGHRTHRRTGAARRQCGLLASHHREPRSPSDATDHAGHASPRPRRRPRAHHRIPALHTSTFQLGHARRRAGPSR